MAPANKQDGWFIDKATEQVYGVVWNGTMPLETDALVQVLTTILIFQKHCESLGMLHCDPISN
jgi:hypothetical protein